MPGAATVVFYGLSALVLGGAVGVAFSHNILRSAFLLLATLGGTAGLYLFLGADFVGVTQLLVYVGGILVLLLFAVLLTGRIGDAAATNRAVGRGVAVPLALLTGLLLVMAAVTTPWRRTEAIAAPTTARIGDGLLNEYLLPFELISLVLLMALVGAMVVARRSTPMQRSATPGATATPGVGGAAVGSAPSPGREP